MKDSIEKLLGIFMHDAQGKRELYTAIKQEWFEDEYQDVYKAIGDVLLNEDEPNLITISKQLISNEKNHLVPMCSRMMSSCSYIDMYSINSLVEMVKYNYVVLGMHRTMSNIKNVVSADQLNFDEYIKALSNGIEMFNKEMIKSDNDLTDVIRNVLLRHEKAKHGDLGGITLGFSNLNDDIILEPVDMMVIGARPAMGKTSFGVALICRLLFNEKRKVVFFNLEMSNEQLMRRIIANLTGIDSNKIKKGLCDEKEVAIIQQVISRPELKNLTLYEGSQTITQMKMKLSELKHNNKVDIFIVDYLQKITPEFGKSRYEQVTSVSNGVKFISQNMHIPSVAMAQLGRDAGKTGKRPILPDLRESGEIEQDASIVAFLHRPEYYGKEIDDNGYDVKGLGEFIIAKNREGECNISSFKIDLATNTWKEMGISNNFVTTNNPVPF